jgi:hypothetical protein
MLDAIQRLRLERRYALLFAGVFVVLAVLCHWLSGGGPAAPEAYPPAQSVEVRE